MTGSGFQRMVDEFAAEMRDIRVAEARRGALAAEEVHEPVVPEDQRQAVLRTRIVGFDEAPGSEVFNDVARVVVLEACDDLGLDAGAEIGVAMSAHPEDGNWILHNMVHGDTTTGTPECGEGSIVTFTGCSMALGTPVVQASSFEVVEAVTPSVGMRM